MCFDNMLYYLSRKFYNDYPYEDFPEILWNKKGRAYNCLLIDSHDGYFICVPFRSNVPHKYAYLFKNTIRSQNSPSGIDYMKMVIIKNNEYIDLERTAIVDTDEFTEMMQNIERIVKEVKEFLQDYIDYINGERNISPQEFRRRYTHSTLPYFNRELGL